LCAGHDRAVKRDTQRADDDYNFIEASARVFRDNFLDGTIFDIVNGGVGDASSNVNESSAAIMSLVVTRLYKGIGHGNKNRLCFLGRARRWWKKFVPRALCHANWLTWLPG